MEYDNKLTPDEYENKYVHSIYSKIAKEFNYTRYRVWESVRKFLDSIPDHANICEIGAGNGKNYTYKPSLKWTAVEPVKELCDICRMKGINVIQGNNLDLPIEDSKFDFCLSVAVIHHLSTYKRRLKAISEIIRILKIGGKALISVWALEQQKDSVRKFKKQDELVPWKTPDPHDKTVYLRYYHLFVAGELECLLNIFSVEIIKSFYEKGNWIVEFKKI